MSQVGTTPDIDETTHAHARANLEWDPEARTKLLDRDWRAPRLPYRVPPSLRLQPPATGEPTTCTEELCQRVEALVLTGASVLAAKTACGINRNLWRHWSDLARADKRPYWEFFERMKLATAHVENAQTRTIAAAAEHPDASIATANAEKILRWTNPKRYAPASKQTVDVRHSGTVGVDVRAVAAIAALDPATVAAMFAAPTAAPLLESTVPTPLLGRGGDDDEGSP